MCVNERVCVCVSWVSAGKKTSQIQKSSPDPPSQASYTILMQSQLRWTGVQHYGRVRIFTKKGGPKQLSTAGKFERASSYHRLSPRSPARTVQDFPRRRSASPVIYGPTDPAPKDDQMVLIVSMDKHHVCWWIVVGLFSFFWRRMGVGMEGGVGGRVAGGLGMGVVEID